LASTLRTASLTLPSQQGETHGTETNHPTLPKALMPLVTLGVLGVLASVASADQGMGSSGSPWPFLIGFVLARIDLVLAFLGILTVVSVFGLLKERDDRVKVLRERVSSKPEITSLQQAAHRVIRWPIAQGVAAAVLFTLGTILLASAVQDANLLPWALPLMAVGIVTLWRAHRSLDRALTRLEDDQWRSGPPPSGGEGSSDGGSSTTTLLLGGGPMAVIIGGMVLVGAVAGFFLRHSIGLLPSSTELSRSADERMFGEFKRWWRELWQSRRLSRAPPKKGGT